MSSNKDNNEKQKYDINKIRNFSIIAHIDHGKSTLADRLIETCGAVDKRDMKAQLLDSMDIERERGITVKSQTVRLEYHNPEDKKIYILNLMDTPGHVDFSYEVSRSLSACEGSLLIVDATQGVEAQTLANVYKAIENDHEIIPVLNKIDLSSAEPEKIKQQIADVIGLDATDAIQISAKTGLGVDKLLQTITEIIPAPKKYDETKCKALLVDAWYDNYLGVILLVRVVKGMIAKGMKIRLLASNQEYIIESVGIFLPQKHEVESLKEGEIGFINANIKSLEDCRVGDTVVDSGCDDVEPLPGFKPSQSVVFCSLFPVDQSEFDKLKDSFAKLKLNDSSIEYKLESSDALGLGFRCGFLGLLHLEVVQERLEREFDLDLITTAPSVIYNLEMNDGTNIELHNPVDMPDPVKINKMYEPWIIATILVPDEYLGNVLQLCTDKRGIQKELSYSDSRVMLKYELPLNETVFDFYDRLKSISSGYASFDWEFIEAREADLVKVNILVNGEIVGPLSMILHKTRAETRGRALCEKLKDLIPRQMFKIAIQAAIGGKIIARETVSALRKDVTAKCYGGDVSRKKKLLEKQKKGKKKMRTIGNVEIPQSAFISALKIDD